MARLLLFFFSLLLAGYLFYAAVPEGVRPALEVLLLILLGAGFVTQSIQYVRRRSEMIAGEEVLPAAVPEGTKVIAEAAGSGETAVVQFLARLQEKGRLVDFALDDIAPYDDRQVAAAARVVHQGCREVLQSVFDLCPVHGGAEGETVTLARDYDARRYRLVGKVPDQPPFRGTLLHRGWRTGRVTLPRVVGAGEAAREVVAPAEVEVG